MSITSNLQAYYNTEVAKISDEGDRLEALADVEAWYNTRMACDSVASNAVTSYSIGGRSVTRQNLSTFRDQEALLLAKVKGWIGRGGGGLVDMSGAHEGYIR